MLPVVCREVLPIQKKSWVLTKEAFDLLLAKLDPNEERAGEKYELVRSQLAKFFECRGCHLPQELADETFNRVARKIAEGEEIPLESVSSYFRGVARNVLREYLRNPENSASSIDDLLPSYHPAEDPENSIGRESGSSSLEQRLACLEACLGKLPPETREMMISYYMAEHSARVAGRKQLAEAFHIPINNLRIRVHRVRKGLERCMKKCIRRSRT